MRRCLEKLAPEEKGAATGGVVAEGVSGCAHIVQQAVKKKRDEIAAAKLKEEEAESKAHAAKDTITSTH